MKLFTISMILLIIALTYYFYKKTGKLREGSAGGYGAKSGQCNNATNKVYGPQCRYENWMTGIVSGEGYTPCSSCSGDSALCVMSAAYYCREWKQGQGEPYDNIECPPGQKRNNSHPGTCGSCPAGQFKGDTSTATSCTNCPPNATSSAGSSSCSCATGWSGQPSACVKECGPGKKRSGTSCINCEVGTYKSTTSSATACTGCPANSNSVAGSTAASACGCVSGYGPGTGGTCVKVCGDGQKVNGDACENCGAGTYKKALNPQGSTLTSCTQCPSGQYSSAGQSACSTCSAGQYSEGGWSACKSCPVDSYSTGTGASVCTGCLIHSGTGTDTGSTTASDCICEEGWSGGGALTACKKECPPGQKRNGITCENCGTGTYKGGIPSTATTCSSCTTCETQSPSQHTTATCTNIKNTECAVCPGDLAPKSTSTSGGVVPAYITGHTSMEIWPDYCACTATGASMNNGSCSCIDQNKIVQNGECVCKADWYGPNATKENSGECVKCPVNSTSYIGSNYIHQCICNTAEGGSVPALSESNTTCKPNCTYSIRGNPETVAATCDTSGSKIYSYTEKVPSGYTTCTAVEPESSSLQLPSNAAAATWNWDETSLRYTTTTPPLLPTSPFTKVNSFCNTVEKLEWQSCTVCSDLNTDDVSWVQVTACDTNHPGKDTVCKKCGKGQISVGGECGCLVGFAWNKNFNKCLAGCPAGEGRKNAACTPCKKGTWGEGGENQCSPCPANTTTLNSNTTAEEDCVPIAGYFQGTPGTPATACPVGQFKDYDGVGNCIPCAPGSYQSLTGQQQCTPCAPGKSQYLSGQTQCTDCSAGYYHVDKGGDKCHACEPGTYQPQIGMSTCLKCPPGHKTSLTNANTTCLPECEWTMNGCSAQLDQTGAEICGTPFIAHWSISGGLEPDTECWREGSFKSPSTNCLDISDNYQSAPCTSGEWSSCPQYVPTPKKFKSMWEVSGLGTKEKGSDTKTLADQDEWKDNYNRKLKTTDISDCPTTTITERCPSPTDKGFYTGGPSVYYDICFMPGAEDSRYLSYPSSNFCKLRGHGASALPGIYPRQNPHNPNDTSNPELYPEAPFCDSNGGNPAPPAPWDCPGPTSASKPSASRPWSNKPTEIDNPNGIAVCTVPGGLPSPFNRDSIFKCTDYCLVNLQDKKQLNLTCMNDTGETGDPYLCNEDISSCDNCGQISKTMSSTETTLDAIYKTISNYKFSPYMTKATDYQTDDLYDIKKSQV